MKTKKYIYEKQEQWAKNQGIKLSGKEEKSSRENYVISGDDNVFQGLHPTTRGALLAADGGELTRSGDKLAKIDAVHSSSALGINVFQYWVGKPEISRVAELCGFFEKGSHECIDLQFEQKFRINSTQSSPNLDVVFRTDGAKTFDTFAIESKFSEPFPTRNPEKKNSYGLRDAYFTKENWCGLPNLKELAERHLKVHDAKFHHLHASQLIKHILGLRDSGGKFRLLYLYFDGLGKEGDLHQKEIKEFQGFCDRDGVKFRAMSYQSLLVKLAREFRKEHSDYVSYVTGRYL